MRRDHPFSEHAHEIPTMPLPRFLSLSANHPAATTAARMIWRSKVMALGVACEILALIAVAWNWYESPQWLPNAALTLATVGAVIVASRVAWDYHGRGLNAKQGEEIQNILTEVGLNAPQLEAIGEIIESSGLNTRQKEDLKAALQDADIVRTVAAQRAIADAIDQLRDAEHGHVVVIRVTGLYQFDVQLVAPPTARGQCQRQHEYEPESDFNFLEVAKSLYERFSDPAVLWKHPVTGHLLHTNRNDPRSFTTELVFSFEDCVPKWRVPSVGDHVLMLEGAGRSTWVKKI